MTKAQAKRLSAAMMAAASLLLAASIHQVSRHVSWRRQMSTASAGQVVTTQPATQPATRPAADGAQPPSAGPAKPHEVAAAIRKRNIFTAPTPPGHGMRLTGVIGGTALFANRSGGTTGIEEGQSGGGIKVVSIQGYEVTIEYEGKTETLKLFSDGPAAGPGGPGMIRPPRPPGMMPGGPPVMRPGGPGPSPIPAGVPPEVLQEMMRKRQ